MHVKLLGTAAGGGFPQWNCACRNCQALREGRFCGIARTQLQVAISADGQSWFLLGASPDIRTQIESDPALQPRHGVRSTPISGVVLTSADLDQVLGVLILREFQRFRIYATAGLQTILREDNSIFGILNRVPEQAEWQLIAPTRPFSLLSGRGEAGLRCTAFSAGEHYPAYVSDARRRDIRGDELSLGLMVQGASGRRLAYFPAVSAITPSLCDQLASADVVLVDGTFWCDEELRAVRGAGPTAREIGHVPVSGEDGSLQRLSGLQAARKIYLHINNTNPMLDKSSAECRQVRDAGWEIAEDGWEFEL